MSNVLLGWPKPPFPSEGLLREALPPTGGKLPRLLRRRSLPEEISMGLGLMKHQATTRDVRAIVNGNYPGDPHEVIKSMASSLAKELCRLDTRGYPDDLLDIIERQLEGWLVLKESTTPDDRKSSGLPVATWSPAEVVAQQKLSALTTLYRYDKDGKVYCVMPKTKKNGRVFPAWQFVEPVPSLLQTVIAELRGVLQFEIHAFFVTQQDDLNELSPAEVLAGLPFESRSGVTPGQQRLLSLPTAERLRKVVQLAKVAGRSMTE
ncbi:hypothetical protein LMG26846_00053 [Achromobacter insuavis]|nr:hypothetical protein LMG26846_00053 [Achromobacter insuavis]